MRILGVGIATLDIVCRVAAYPREDDEIRAQGIRLARGGNATNTLAALSALGHECAWAGVLVDEPDSTHILKDLSRWRIDTSHVVRLANGKVPTSYILSSKTSGSRTIVHYRDLPEYRQEAFASIALEEFDWVHFEGRQVGDLEVMLKRVVSSQTRPCCSLEIEKPRPGIETLFSLPDALLFSRHYALSRGHTDPTAFLEAVRRNGAPQPLFCAWGEQGGMALDAEGRLHMAPAYPPPCVVDTLGAGDVFNAGVIHGLLAGMDVGKVLETACRLAGDKCGREGFEGLRPEPD